MTAQMDTFKSENTSTVDLIGQNWQKLIDIIESRPDENEAKSFDGGGSQRQYRTDDNVLRALQDVKRLRQKDMALFGHCPETDTFYTVVCSSCSMILMPHALKDHYEKRHRSDGESKPYPDLDKQQQLGDSQNKSKSKKVTPVKLDKSKKVKPGTEPPAERVDKSKKGKPPDGAEAQQQQQQQQQQSMGLRQDKSKPKSNGAGGRFAQSESQAMSPVSAGETSESNDGKDLPKRKQKEKKRNERKADKVFDPDRHCGVINDSGKPCVRSILCKVHQVAMKRAVPNRSMTYDMLIRIMKTTAEDERTKTDGGVPAALRGKSDPCDAVGGRQSTSSVDGALQSSSSSSSSSWVGQESQLVAAKPVEEQQQQQLPPPAKRLKVKEEEVVEDEADQTQFALPSHLEALIDETLRTLKEVEEGDPVPSILPVPPKPEPILKWSLEPVPTVPTAQDGGSPGGGAAATAPALQPQVPQIILDDVPWHSSHPKPLATNTFGCRLIGGLMSTCKKLDTLRKHLQSVWTSSASGVQPMNSCFADAYSPTGNKANGVRGEVAAGKAAFAYAKFGKKPPAAGAAAGVAVASAAAASVPAPAKLTSATSAGTLLAKKTVPSPATKGTSVKRKRKASASLIASSVQASSNASDIISGLLIGNTVPIQRAGPGGGTGSVPAIPTGVIPVNSITGNGVPLRLFQGSLPVIASAAPNQPATFIQLNLCPK